jgi:glutamate-1-semialdehyde 2,1-aminomutase
VYQAGTLSGNPLAVAAGIAALEALASEDIYRVLEERGQQLEDGLGAAAKRANIPVQFNRCGSMFCGYFTSAPVHNLDDAMKSDRERFARYFHGMLAEGVYLAPSQFEAGFISAAHSAEDIERTIAAAERVLQRIG